MKVEKILECHQIDQEKKVTIATLSIQIFVKPSSSNLNILLWYLNFHGDIMSSGLPWLGTYEFIIILR